MTETLWKIAEDLSHELERLHFAPPVTHVYDPLTYAAAPHRLYLERYGAGSKEVVLVGMNPGPWGMAQTGVPFGEIAAVRDWMGIEAAVGRPEHEHPKRPIEGFACARSEVSGRRLWGWARDTAGSARGFFERFFVANYCPLVFMEASGRNRTPDHLPAAEREPLFELCDAALRRLVVCLGPSWVVGRSEEYLATLKPEYRGGRILIRVVERGPERWQVTSIVSGEMLGEFPTRDDALRYGRAHIFLDEEGEQGVEP